MYFLSSLKIKSLEKRPSSDTDWTKNYAKPISDDLAKFYVITVAEACLVEQCSDKELHLPNNLISDPIIKGMVRKVSNGPAKFHDTSFKFYCSLPNLLQNLINVIIGFRLH